MFIPAKTIIQVFAVFNACAAKYERYTDSLISDKTFVTYFPTYLTNTLYFPIVLLKLTSQGKVPHEITNSKSVSEVIKVKNSIPVSYTHLVTSERSFFSRVCSVKRTL